MPLYKRISNLPCEADFIKTTTMKIKRYQKMPGKHGGNERVMVQM